MPNEILHRDNLVVLGEMANSSVDLIYLDPPFNSGRNYNVTVEDSMAHEVAYVDTWTWDEVAQASFASLQESGPEKLKLIMNGLQAILLPKDPSMLSYLAMMVPRLLELHRVLRTTGSIYLHCDPTASHYLKIILDAIFGVERRLGDIIWKRTSAHNKAQRPGPIHDVILFYTKSLKYTWNLVRHKSDKTYAVKFDGVDGARAWRVGVLTGPGIRNGESGKPWRNMDPSSTGRGRHWAIPTSLRNEYKTLKGMDLTGSIQEQLDKLDEANLLVLNDRGTLPGYKMYVNEDTGNPVLQDIWTDVPPVSWNSEENADFDGQKPIALLERIIQASSNKGDLVLDPFLGSGTTAVAAQRLERRWVGIELTPKTSLVAQRRLDMEFGEGIYEQTHDWPTDAEAAKALAKKDPYRFQCWVVKQLKGLPTGRGGDRGIDGNLTLKHFADNKSRNAIIQVKGGTASPENIRAFLTVLEKTKSVVGLFVAFKEYVTPGMRQEARDAGTFRSGHTEDTILYPKIQILHVEELFNRSSRMAGALIPGHVQSPDLSQTKDAIRRREQGLFNMMQDLDQED